ncbi:MAG: ABC transporter ATP-binding protein [Firmicutes bacterium]|nr:ABC transporter ATP-binding protein [Bacillota bacterium]MDY6159866.1 ABC transporter ATP-binding protein [Candidatus Faecousia sp.]
MSILEVRQLTAGYGGKEVLQGVSFSLMPGELVGILGENGSGKTTLLKSICGIVPHGGSCLVGGTDSRSLSPRALARQVSYIPQQSGISIDLSALDVVLMGFNPRLGLLEYPSQDMKQQARRALREVGLAGREEENYQTLSQGQRQLCMLARTLVSQARLLLLDEPESALDFGGRYRMLSQLRRCLGGHCGALVTLHDPQLALNCCDRLLLLGGGKLLGEICPKQDSLESMEEKLIGLYGGLTLIRAENRQGLHQLVLLK